jgi:hypothetical protein
LDHGRPPDSLRGADAGGQALALHHLPPPPGVQEQGLPPPHHRLPICQEVPGEDPDAGPPRRARRAKGAAKGLGEGGGVFLEGKEGRSNVLSRK